MDAEARSKLPPGEYIVLGGDAPDRKRASFRLGGDALDPDAITRATGLTPHTAHRKGEARPRRERLGDLPPWRSGVWSVHSEDALPQTDNHLEDHLIWLLDRLDPVRETLRQLRVEQSLTADFFCGYFMHQSNSGVGFSVQTLARIVALDATLGVDIYGPGPEDANRTEIVEGKP
jgi:hypothetical protein